jgi:hypothetical protein
MTIQYELEFDIDYDGQFANPDGHIGDRLLSASWSLGMSDGNQLISSPMQASATIYDPNLDFSQDREDTPFGIGIRGMLVRLRATVNGNSYTLVTGWIKNVVSHEHASRFTTSITFEDKILELQDAEYLPMLSTNTRIDTELQNLFDTGIVAYPYDRSYWVMGASQLDIDTVLYDEQIVELDESFTTLDWVGDAADRGTGVSGMGYVTDLVSAEVGGRFFTNRAGKFVFHNRYRDFDTLVSDTFSAEDYDNADAIQTEVFNVVTVNYMPRQVGTPGQVLFSSQNVPFSIPPYETRVIKGRYNDPDNPNASVGGMDIIDPVPVTDYLANLAEDGLSSDVTGSLHVAAEKGATSAQISITNGYRRTAYIQKLQIRGTPLITHQQEQVEFKDAESIQLYGEVPLQPYELRFVSNITLAEGYAQEILNRFKVPRTRYSWIEFILGSRDGVRDDLANRVLSCRVGDKINVSNSVTGHTRDYVIVGEQHQVNGIRHSVRYILRPSNRTAIWVLNTSRLNNDTILGL